MSVLLQQGPPARAGAVERAREEAEDRAVWFRLVGMTRIPLMLATALIVLAAALAGITLSSDPEWQHLSAKGTDVAMEELTLPYERLGG
jgi:hypothetical protein